MPRPLPRITVEPTGKFSARVNWFGRVVMMIEERFESFNAFAFDCELNGQGRIATWTKWRDVKRSDITSHFSTTAETK